MCVILLDHIHENMYKAKRAKSVIYGNVFTVHTDLCINETLVLSQLMSPAQDDLPGPTTSRLWGGTCSHRFRSIRNLGYVTQLGRRCYSGETGLPWFVTDIWY